MSTLDQLRDSYAYQTIALCEPSKQMLPNGRGFQAGKKFARKARDVMPRGKAFRRIK